MEKIFGHQDSCVHERERERERGAWCLVFQRSYLNFFLSVILHLQCIVTYCFAFIQNIQKFVLIASYYGMFIYYASHYVYVRMGERESLSLS